MNSFDLMQNLSFLQYQSGDSYLHKMHPVLKLTALLVGMASVFLATLWPQLPLLFLCLSVLAILAGFNVFSMLKAVKPVLPFLILILIIQFFLIPRSHESDSLFSVLGFQVYREELEFSGQLFGRFFTLFLLFTLFTSSTTVSEISHGTEMMMRPVFGKNGLSQDFSLIITITFRFIPILMLEAEHITKAQASRGAHFGTWKMGFLKKIRLYIPLLVPIFISALEKAEDLVDAMEARCYEAGQERGRLQHYPWKRNDSFFLIFILSGFTVLLVSRIL